MKRRKILFFQCIFFLIILLIIIFYYFFRLNNRTSSVPYTELTLKFDQVEFGKLDAFFKRLNQDGFNQDERLYFERSGSVRFSDCNSNQYYQFNGSGIKWYGFKSNTRIYNKYYPSFSVLILTFDSTIEAEKYKKIIEKSELQLNSGYHCGVNKGPHAIITKGHFVYYISSANIFLDYVVKYAKVLQDLPM